MPENTSPHISIYSVDALYPSTTQYPSSYLFPAAGGEQPGDYLGHIEGWSVEIDATPGVIGDESAGAGEVRLSALRKADVEFIQNRPLRVLGSSGLDIEGKVESVSISSPLLADVVSGTALSPFVADMEIPAVASGSPAAAIDMACQLTRGSRGSISNPNYTNVIYWSLAGHNIGFHSDGSVAYPEAGDSSYVFIIDEVSELYDVGLAPNVQNTFTGNYFTQWRDAGGENSLWCNAGAGSSFTPAPGVQYFLIATLNHEQEGTSPFEWTMRTGPNDPLANTGKTMLVSVDLVNSELTVSLDRYVAGVQVNTLSTVSLSSLDMNSEIRVIVSVKYESPVSISLAAMVANTGAESTGVTTGTGSLSATMDDFAEPYSITSGVGFRDLYTGRCPKEHTLAQVLSSTSTVPASEHYVIDDSAPTPSNVPIVGMNGSLWDFLKQIAAATGSEYRAYALSSIIEVRGISAAEELVLSNYDVYPDRSVSDQNAARYIEVVNYNSENKIGLFRIYDASDEEETWEIGVNQTKQVILDVGHYATSVQGPIPVSNLYDQIGED